MNARDPLADFTLHIFYLSFLAIGGANAVIPELHRMSVDNLWMSDGTFADLFAIAQVTPGPNVVLVTVIGWYVAGIPGALAGTLLMCVPTGAAACVMAGLSTRFQHARPRIAIQRGLAALAVGIVLASTYILMQATETGWAAYVVTGLAAAGMLLIRANPIYFIALGALAGAAGYV